MLKIDESKTIGYKAIILQELDIDKRKELLLFLKTELNIEFLQPVDTEKLNAYGSEHLFFINIIDNIPVEYLTYGNLLYYYNNVKSKKFSPIYNLKEFKEEFLGINNRIEDLENNLEQLEKLLNEK